MERLASGSNTKAQSSPRSGRTESASKARPDKANPRSRAVNRSTRASDFSAFADDVRRDLNPRGPLESLMTDHVIQAAWRLRATLDREAARTLDDADRPGQPQAPPKRAAAPAADRAARSVKEALESLDTVRLIRKVRGQAAAEPDTFPEVAPNEWPVVPIPAAGDEIEDMPVDDAPHWRDRLAFDFEVSDSSPIIKGTWITVGHVISLIVDGETWADILRSHPELSEDDIRTCLAYTMAEDELAG